MAPHHGLVELSQGALQASELAGSGITAWTFGVALPNGKLAYAAAPTWMLYGGEGMHCFEDIPVLVRRDTFCDVFVAEARIFHTYSSWLLSMLLVQVTIS